MYSKVLTDEQIKKIHKASLNILESVGTIVPHKEVLQRFADKGAKVDFNTQNVKIPADLVMKLLSQAGKKFTLYGRDITKKAEFGYGKRNYNSIAGEAHWIDEIGKQRRFATLNDVAIANRFCDAIDLINICGAMTDPQEIPIEYRVVEVVYQQIKNTTKPIAFWFNDRASAKYVIDMLIALRGSVEKAIEMPMYYILFEPISPLKFPFEGIDYLFETSKVNLPITVGPMAQIGLTAPCSIAGTMCLENADILAGICVTQLVKPGMPICYGGICHSFDMSTTQMVFCGPEQAIFGVGMTQLAKYYGFPVFINVGLTDSKCVDGQAGLEIGTTLVLGASAGADIFGHSGICGVDQASSLDMLVFQSEVISYVESVMRTIDFSDEALGINEIIEVGPGGKFIDRLHTAERFRKELWFPKLLDRNFYQLWLDSGANDISKRCKEYKEQVLKNHQPKPIDGKLDKTLKEIVETAKKELSVGKNV